MMEFVKDLQEARMTRTDSGLEKLSYNDCIDRAYLCLLILELLKHFPVHKSRAKKYAKETAQHDNYDKFRMNSTDLYNFLYLVNGKDEDLEKLRNPEAAKKARENYHPPIMSINRYLTKISHGKTLMNSSEFFINLERSLQIKNSDYKNARRVLTNFNKERRSSIKKAVTRVLYAARARLRSSDLIDDLEKVAVDRDLETSGVKDTEPVITDPDTDVINKEIQTKDLIYLQRIVGAENLRLAIEFIKLNNKGKTIPSNLSKAINPAIELLVDIIQGGQSHVARLQQLRRLALKDQERKKS